MGIFSFFSRNKKKRFHYISDPEIAEKTNSKSILDYFEIDLEAIPDDTFRHYRTKKGRNWQMERYHKYLHSPAAGLFPEVDVIIENGRKQVQFFSKELSLENRKQFLDWVAELHQVLGEDANGFDGLDEEDTKVLNPDNWEEEPFWQGRQWPAYENSPQFKLGMSELEGLTCLIWLP